jgi:hypothetical protein
MTPTQQPVMTLEETKEFVRFLRAESVVFRGRKHERSRVLDAVLHHLEAGKLACQCEAWEEAFQADNTIWSCEEGLKIGYGNPAIRFCPWCGGTVSPQPSQQEGQ